MAGSGMLGILGGMGPLATADFFRKLVEETDAGRDQDHIPVVMCSLPDIPCRTTAILADGESPLPRMLDGLRKLNRMGAQCIVIPCNTAHYWHEELSAASEAPILHMVDAVGAQLALRGKRACHLGILGTESTISAGIYPQRLDSERYTFSVNTPQERAALVSTAIELVKGGRPQEAGELLERAIELLLQRGVHTPILACTELPVALSAINSPLAPRCIDATRALALAAVNWWQGQRALPLPLAAATHDEAACAPV